MKKYLIIVSVFIFVLAMVAGSQFMVTPSLNIVKADSTPVPVSNTSGWAWSSNIGWISFRNISGSTYGVDVAEDGTMSGYAWSNELGWLSFNWTDVGGYCAGATPAEVVYNADKTNGWAVTGWAVFLTGKTVANDGWDGCLELSGSNHTSPKLDGSGGVTLNPYTGIFNGFAWGGIVVGWVNFDPNITFGPDPGNPTNPPIIVPRATNLPTLDHPVTCSSGNCGMTGSAPQPLVTCTSPISPAPIASTGGSVTAPANSVTVSGGSGSGYEIKWYNGQNTHPPSAWIGVASPATLQYDSHTDSVDKNYTPHVIARDSAGTQSNLKSCGSVTVRAQVVVTGNPELWFPKLGARPVNYITPPTLRIKSGQDADIKYSWDSTGNLTCYGRIKNAPTGWNSTSNAKLWEDDSNPVPKTLNNGDDTGSFKFTSLPRGTYTFYVECRDLSNAQFLSNDALIISAQSSLIEI